MSLLQQKELLGRPGLHVAGYDRAGGVEPGELVRLAALNELQAAPLTGSPLAAGHPRCENPPLPLPPPQLVPVSLIRQQVFLPTPHDAAAHLPRSLNHHGTTSRPNPDAPPLDKLPHFCWTSRSLLFVPPLATRRLGLALLCDDDPLACPRCQGRAWGGSLTAPRALFPYQAQAFPALGQW